ncbi:hypothetical protein DP130_01245 [Clostridium tetani]|uniref:Uncharacterized protein n=1 Tax=Clostridium tetani TaxID=1513 RepID=A0A4V1LF15_CLOTA|nr:hypothetical protein [Clostridium tetani]RXI50626.1 hypothetical protein DP130_01245 [Clostridium tetani]BDR66646.1 hypothetical protein K144312032_08740 [Clostridium tetani]
MKSNNVNEKSIWLPNQLSAVKLFLIQIECSINEVYEQLEGKTLYEYTILNKDLSGVVKVLPEVKDSPILNEYERMLPLDKVEFLYQSVYKKTGGVLNMFYGEIKESMDVTLKELSNREEDMNKAIEMWKDTKSELWSGLKPKHVWAGGGPLEKELLLDFCKELTLRMQGQQFTNQGTAIIKSLELLRKWQLEYNEICKGIPVEEIVKEREEIYIRKVKFLKDMNINFDLSDDYQL